MKRWTIEEENKLIEYIEQEHTSKDISSELGRSIKSIQHKRTRLGIALKNTSRLKTNKQYILELSQVNSNFIALEKYVGNRIPILHKCLLCNSEYKSTPETRLVGRGCNICSHKDNSGSIPLDKPGITYLVYIPRYKIYKFGITSKTINERMLDNNIPIYDNILERRFDLGIDAINLEKLWKSNLSKYLVNTGKLKTGNTETFKL